MYSFQLQLWMLRGFRVYDVAALDRFTGLKRNTGKCDQKVDNVLDEELLCCTTLRETDRN